VSEGFFLGRAKREISFFLLETKKMIFFAKNVIEKCKISKSRGLALPSDAHVKAVGLLLLTIEFDTY